MPSYAVYKKTTGVIERIINVDEEKEFLVQLNTPSDCGYVLIPSEINANGCVYLDGKFIKVD